MKKTARKKKPVESWNRKKIALGERKKILLKTGETFSGTGAQLPIMVWRGVEKGPVLGITAAVHGDEVNGTGAIQKLIQNPSFDLKRGSLILVPVINIMGFERHSRYTPDRRDLNRTFPGTTKGSLAGRLANLMMKEVVARCDYILDLHTAATCRTNFPNVRADMENPDCVRLAKAFGTEVIVDSNGPEGSFRSEACKAGCPTIILEAGEVLKAESSVQEMTLRGINHIMEELNMIDVPHGMSPEVPPHQMVVHRASWVRAENAGFLTFHVAPGDTVEKGQAIATNADLLGKVHETILSPNNGIVLGMTTMPAVYPGDPVIHIALPENRKEFRSLEKSVDKIHSDALESQVRNDLATSITVVEYIEDQREINTTI